MKNYPKISKYNTVFKTVFVLFLLIQSSCFEKANQSIVAKINEDVITVTDLNHRLSEYKFDPTLSVKEINTDFKKTVLNEMIQETLTEQLAHQKGIEVTNQEVDQNFASIFEVDHPIQKPSEAETKQIKRKIYQQILATKLFQEVTNKVPKPSEQEIKAYYDKHPEKFLQEDQIRIRQVILKNKEEATKFLNALDKTSFEQLGNLYTQEPQNTFIKDTGFFPKGILDQDLEKKVFRMQPGTTSNIIQTEQGFHIIEILEKKKESALALEEVFDFIDQNLYQQKKENAYNEWLEEQIIQSQIEKNHALL